MNGTVILPPLVFPADTINSLAYQIESKNKFIRSAPVFSGLYYKLTTIVNYASSVISEQSFQLIDHARVVIYDRHVFIAQAAE